MIPRRIEIKGDGIKECSCKPCIVDSIGQWRSSNLDENWCIHIDKKFHNSCYL
jgi:hypothetical protein